MRSAIATTLRQAVDAIRLTMADAGLRRLLIAWFAGIAGKAAFLVTTFVVAYDQGGATAVGILGLAQFVPQMIVGPLSGLPTARWAPEAVLRLTLVIRVLAIVAAAWAIALGAPLWVLILTVVVEAAASALHRPLQMGLQPAVASTPEQLVGANVGSSAAEGLGTFVGPALAGLLLVAGGPLAATIVVVALYAIGLAAIGTLDVPAVGRTAATARVVLGQLSAGVRTVASDAGLRLLFVGIGGQTLVRGLLNVLLVIASIEFLGMGDGGVGTLNAAIGLGGLIGALIATVLAGSRRLGPPFIVSLAAWGAPIAVVGLVVSPAVAIVAMGAVGLANAVLDVAAFTLLQRLSPNQSRVAVLGLVELVANGAIALGGIVAPVLVEAVGIQTALVVTGAILPVVAVVSGLFVRRLDKGGVADPARVALLRADPLFCPLSLATIEHLAGALRPFDAPDGTILIQEGDRGDEYFLLDDGGVDVIQAGQVVATKGRGEGVGEVAMLRDVPRTATIRAIGEVRGFRLGRSDFLEAVTGHPLGRAAADERVAAHLAADRERAGLH